MPKRPGARPLDEYHSTLGRMLRQMQADPRIRASIRGNVGEALKGITTLMVEEQDQDQVSADLPKR